MGRSQINPTAVGIGLRIPLYRELIETKPSLDFVEIIADNFLDLNSQGWDFLDPIRGMYPVVLHCVGMNLLSADPLNWDYIARVKKVAEKLNAPLVSDHLCWTSLGDFHSYDLLPTPFRKDLIGPVSQKVRQVQDFLDRPFALENLSSYLKFDFSEMEEWEFYAEIVKQAGCYFLLDVNNIYVSSQNQAFCPFNYLKQIPFDLVKQIHLAGHETLESGFKVDTHDSVISPEVWELYQWVCQKKGDFPTLVEWDDKIPDLPDVMAETLKIKECRSI
jgi:uncharacterized protein (UPF0276 family)